MLSKLDSLGESFDRPLKVAKERISSENLKTKELQERATAASHVCSPDSPDCAEECPAQNMSVQARQSLKEDKVNCHPGFVIAFDNIDHGKTEQKCPLGQPSIDSEQGFPEFVTK